MVETDVYGLVYLVNWTLAIAYFPSAEGDAWDCGSYNADSVTLYKLDCMH